VEERRGAAGTLADALAEHLDDLVEVLALEVAVGGGATDEVEEGVVGPVLASALGDELLGEDVEGGDGLDDAVEEAAADGADEGGALDELVAGRGEEAAVRTEAEGMAGAADALEEGGDGAGRADLDDEVDGADVDAELQGGRADEGAHLAVLEALLHPEAALTGEAAMVAGNFALAEALAKVVGDTLREAAGIDEDEGGAVGTDQLGDPVVELAPLLPAGDGLEVGGRDLDVELDVALVAEVDDGAGKRAQVHSP
jgi:hypothetical protein